MNKLALYTLPLKTLSVGEHTFHYKLDNDFFSAVEGPEISEGDVDVELHVIKNNLNVDLTFFLEGTIQVNCNRCLEPMPMEIDSEEHLIVKFGENYSEESDELIVISEDEGTLNIAWLMYEFLALAIPIAHSHQEGECNEEMINAYKRVRVRSLGDDDEDEDDDDTEVRENDKVDPRWEALKNIIDNN